MAARAFHLLSGHLPSGTSSASPGALLPVIGVGLAAVAGLLATRSSYVQVAIVLAVLPLGFAVVWMSPRATIVGLAIFLAALGLLRRVVPGGSGSSVGEPLLLIGPAVLILLFVVAVSRGGLRQRTPLANGVLLLSGMVLVESVNPLQGGLLVGLGGLLLILVPMLAFWAGRALLDDQLLRRLLWVVAVVSIIAALYGLLQEFVGFPSWDERWINSAGYVALNVGSVTRAFGSFASAQEYATFLSLGLVAWIALIRGRRTPLLLHLVAIVLLAVTLVLESERTGLVLTILALGIMLAARARRRPLGTILIALVALVSLNLVAGHFLDTSATVAKANQGSTSTLINHDLSGLANPTGQGSSLPDHFRRAIEGVESAFTHPLGYGTGAVTVATGKLGGVGNRGTENDFGNAGVAFGSLGLIAFVFVVIRGYVGSYRLAARRTDDLSLAVLGFLSVTLGQWMSGGLYSVVWLIWLALGWIDARAGGTGPMLLEGDSAADAGTSPSLRSSNDPTLSRA